MRNYKLEEYTFTTEGTRPRREPTHRDLGPDTLPKTQGGELPLQPDHRHLGAQRAGTWFEDEEIYGWFAKNLHRVRGPSFRHYVRAKESKAAGMDWTEVLAEEVENRQARLATEILGSAAYDSTAARVAAFVQQGCGCRATFFNYRRRLGNGTEREPGA